VLAIWFNIPISEGSSNHLLHFCPLAEYDVLSAVTMEDTYLLRCDTVYSSRSLIVYFSLFLTTRYQKRKRSHPPDYKMNIGTKEQQKQFRCGEEGGIKNGLDGYKLSGRVTAAR
jgi:hypothetical protein